MISILHPAAARLIVRLLAPLGAAAFVFVATGAAPALAAVELAHGDKRIELSIEDLAAMPQHEIRTETDFTDGMRLYRGPLARDVLALVGLDTVEMVRFIALNDYFVDIPVSDFTEFDVIMALESDGQRLSRRDKGPVWLMYPISDHEVLADPRYNARLIWQVRRIEGM
jgi:hypothetical protein